MWDFNLKSDLRKNHVSSFCNSWCLRDELLARNSKVLINILWSSSGEFLLTAVDYPDALVKFNPSPLSWSEWLTTPSLLASQRRGWLWLGIIVWVETNTTGIIYTVSRFITWLWGSLFSVQSLVWWSWNIWSRKKKKNQKVLPTCRYAYLHGYICIIINLLPTWSVPARCNPYQKSITYMKCASLL